MELLEWPLGQEQLLLFSQYWEVAWAPWHYLVGDVVFAWAAAPVAPSFQYGKWARLPPLMNC